MQLFKHGVFDARYNLLTADTCEVGTAVLKSEKLFEGPRAHVRCSSVKLAGVIPLWACSMYREIALCCLLCLTSVYLL